MDAMPGSRRTTPRSSAEGIGATDLATVDADTITADA
jgi:hypothetical protein